MHLAKVTDRKEPEPIPVNQVKEEISELIKSEKRDEKLKQYMKSCVKLQTSLTKRLHPQQVKDYN